MRNVHDLPGAVNPPAILRHRQHIRVRLHHPGGHRVGGSADNHGNPRRLHGVHHPHHMAEIKHPRLGFTGTPGGFRNPHHIDPRRLHHFHVFVQTVTGHIFIVICHAIQ